MTSHTEDREAYITDLEGIVEELTTELEVTRQMLYEMMDKKMDEMLRNGDGEL